MARDLAGGCRRDDSYQLFEYACPDGNYAMRNILSGERATAKGSKSASIGLQAPGSGLQA